MGIDEGDVRKVVRVGCPPSIEQLVQEFGRAGRDGLPCEGIIFYHDSDLQHASFWHKAESSLDHKKAILKDFQDSWWYVYNDIVIITLTANTDLYTLMWEVSAEEKSF